MNHESRFLNLWKQLTAKKAYNTGGNRRMSDSEMSPASETSDVHRLVMRNAV